jgi:NitT/TauT family transport system substrate-binding protein
MHQATRARLWILAGLLSLDALLWFGAFAWRKSQVPPPLSVAVGISPGSETLILARNQRNLPDARINLVEMNWSSAAMRALGNRVVDAAVLSLDEVLRLRESGQDVRIALVLDISRGADALMAKPAIKTVADLRGKRVGVEMRSVGMLLLGKALAGAGLSVNDVQLVPLNLAETDTAYLEDNLDAVVSAEPWLTRLREAGALNLFDSKIMDGQLCHVLAVQQEVLKQHADNIAFLIAQHFHWREQLVQKTTFDGYTAICRRESLSEAEFKAALNLLHLPDHQENQHLLGGTVPQLQGTSANLAKFMVQERLIKSAPPLPQLLEPRHLEQSR